MGISICMHGVTESVGDGSDFLKPKLENLNSVVLTFSTRWRRQYSRPNIRIIRPIQ